MALEKKQINFIIDCDVEEIVSLLQEDYGMKILDAFNTVYNSNIYKKLIDTETGLYIQSPLYIYEYLKEDMSLAKFKKIIKKHMTLLSQYEFLKTLYVHY